MRCTEGRAEKFSEGASRSSET